MSGVNKVILVGRLGKDPELQQTPTGQSKCQFSLATDASYKDKDGVRKEKVTWHRVVCWGKQADLCKSYLTKGRQVYIEGRLDNRSYEHQGQKRFISEVVGKQIVFLNSPKNGSGGRADAESVFESPEPELEPEEVNDPIPF